jgi:hypothetical protein
MRLHIDRLGLVHLADPAIASNHHSEVSVATNAEFAALSPPRAEQSSDFAAQRPMKASVADADDTATAPIAQATNTESRSIDVALCLSLL